MRAREWLARVVSGGHVAGQVSHARVDGFGAAALGPDSPAPLKRLRGRPDRKCFLIALVVSSLAVETLVIAVHELGHACAARALGYPATFRVRRIKLLGRGVWLMPVARIDFGATMPSRSVDIVVALAGPAASISLGLALLQLPGSLCWTAAVASLFIGFASLLPFRWFDGQHIWHAVQQRESRMVIRSRDRPQRRSRPPSHQRRSRDAGAGARGRGGPRPVGS